MNNITVLLVEDDVTINKMVKLFLQKNGYSVDIAFNGASAWEMFLGKPYDLLILDVMLPSVDGITLLKEFRKINPDTPVIMMTALGDDDSQLKALNLEADDYVIKPFSLPILQRRIEIALKRSGKLSKVIKVGKLKLHPANFTAEFNGKPMDLTKKEFLLLLCLVQGKDMIKSQGTILKEIWGYDFDGNEGIVHAYLNRLRSKLPPDTIKNRKGIGYILDEKALY